MQRKEMHPLCCISIDCPGIGDRSPEPVERETAPEERGGAEGNAGGEGESDVSVAGVLYKWTNFGKGWRSRWFTLRNGVLAYSKIRRREERLYVDGHVRVIGAASARLSRAMEDGAEGRRPKNPVGVVYLKESKSKRRRIGHDSGRDARSYQKRWYPLRYMATQCSAPSQETSSCIASEAFLRPVPFLGSLRYITPKKRVLYAIKKASRWINII